MYTYYSGLGYWCEIDSESRRRRKLTKTMHHRGYFKLFDDDAEMYRCNKKVDVFKLLAAEHKKAPGNLPLEVINNPNAYFFIKGFFWGPRIIRIPLEAGVVESLETAQITDQNIEKKYKDQRYLESSYKIIYSVACEKFGYNPEAKKNIATGGGPYSIKATVENAGLEIDEDTVRNTLQEATEFLTKKTR